MPGIGRPTIWALLWGLTNPRPGICKFFIWRMDQVEPGSCKTALSFRTPSPRRARSSRCKGVPHSGGHPTSTMRARRWGQGPRVAGLWVKHDGMPMKLVRLTSPKTCSLHFVLVLNTRLRSRITHPFGALEKMGPYTCNHFVEATCHVEGLGLVMSLRRHEVAGAKGVAMVYVCV